MMLKCEICRSKQTKFFHKIKKYKYYSCQNCQTLFLYPKPTTRLINKYYSKDFKYSAAEINEDQIRERAKKILKQLIKLNPKGKSLLDIGSGYGYFLDEAQKLNFKVLGIEPSKKIMNVLINQLIDTFINSTFETYYKRNKNKKFDYVSIIHTIEHLPNPIETIQKASRLLKKNGILYIETPNLDSHLFQAEKYSYIFLTPLDHIWLFSLKSFESIFKNIPDIKIKKISTYSYPEHLMGIIKILIRHRLNSKYDPDLIGTKQIINSKIVSDLGFRISNLKYILIDKIIAPLFTSLLNINKYGSILELYIEKK